MKAHLELNGISKKLQEGATEFENSDLAETLDVFDKILQQFQRSFSGSWLGYHAFVYYEGFQAPPPGAHFSVEWGLKETFGDWGSQGNWREYAPEQVTNEILRRCGQKDLSKVSNALRKIEKQFKHEQSEILSVLALEISKKEADGVLNSLRDQIENLSIPSSSAILNAMIPSRQYMTRDATALGQGTKAPPHKVVEAQIKQLQSACLRITELADLARKASSHLARKEEQEVSETGSRKKRGKKPSNNDVVAESLSFESLLHPLIKKHALPHFKSGHLREAVLNAVTALFDFIRKKSDCKEDGDRLINKVFPPENPVLILSDLDTDSGQNDQKGFMQIFKGIYQGVRNPKAHSLSHDLTPHKAAQYLIFVSLLVRRVEEASKPEPTLKKLIG